MSTRSTVTKSAQIVAFAKRQQQAHRRGGREGKGGPTIPRANPVLGLGVDLDWDAVRSHEQLPYTRTYQPSLWHVDGSVAHW